MTYDPNSGNLFIQYIPGYLNNQIIPIALAIAIFEIFRRIQISSNWIINFIGSSTFMIYLIHDNDWIRRAIITDKFKWLAELVPWKIVVLVCGIGFIVFCLSLCIELMRSKIFAALKIETKINMLLNVKTNIEKRMRKAK